MNNKNVTATLTKTSMVLGVSFIASMGVAKADVRTAVDQALNYNPEIRQQWREVLISDVDIDVARSGYQPVVDLTGGYEYTDRNYSENRSFSGAFAEVQLNQLLYNGSQTLYSVRHFRELQYVRYNELLNLANTVTKQTVQAYTDIKRQQDIVKLATDNLRQHQTVFDQVQESVEAGVLRRSDLEQISGRLALSEANLVTQEMNLHDAIARYVRVVGTMPPTVLDDIELNHQILDNNVSAQLDFAYRSNPRFLAAIHNVEAQQHNIEINKGRYKPTVELTASYGARENDQVGIFPGTTREARVGVQVRYNLFRGGSDRANIRRSYEEAYYAEDSRNAVCQDIRQEVQIASNDLNKLNQQLPLLRQHMNASDRVRVAYSDQFSIGSRSLLDVLDSENEFFQASIAYTNAMYDETSRKAELLSGLGVLTYVVVGTTDHFPTPRGESDVSVDFNHVCPSYDLSQYVNY